MQYGSGVGSRDVGEECAVSTAIDRHRGGVDLQNHVSADEQVFIIEQSFNLAAG